MTTYSSARKGIMACLPHKHIYFMAPEMAWNRNLPGTQKMVRWYPLQAMSTETGFPTRSLARTGTVGIRCSSILVHIRAFLLRRTGLRKQKKNRPVSVAVSNSVFFLSDDCEHREGCDDEPTLEALEYAFLTWAEDAKSLVVYMIGHGGDGVFKLNLKDILNVQNLDVWLDELQGTMPGKAILIYEACRSGSFLAQLEPPEGKERIVIASAEGNQKAILAAEGKCPSHPFSGTTSLREKTFTPHS